MENDITWNEFEEKLKELPEKALFRGQENSCWPVTTTLERLLDGREMSFQHYYKSIYQAKSEIESYTGKSWDIPDPPEVGRLTERAEPFARFTAKHARTWPYIAAFFAFRRPIRDVEKVSISVYCEKLNPVNCLKCYSSDQPEIYTLPKQYVRTHQRHFLQRGEYTFCVQNRESEWHFVPHGTCQ